MASLPERDQWNFGVKPKKHIFALVDDGSAKRIKIRKILLQDPKPVIVGASKQRSVNLALETVFEFENNDDLKFIDTVQNFLNKIKRTMDRKRAIEPDKRREFSRYGDKALTFTGFLADTIAILKSYKDEDLKRFFVTLDREIRNWQYQNNILEETDKVGFRRLISSQLADLKDVPASEIRRKLNNVSKKMNFDRKTENNDFIADFLNYLYRTESQMKLTRFLNNLKLYRSRSRRSKDVNLQQIIRNALQTIFKPISLLNTKVASEIDSVDKKYIPVKSDSEQSDHELFYDIKKNLKKTLKISSDIDKAKNMEENDILDYIEDHKKVIEKHIKPEGYVSSSEKTSKKKEYKNSATVGKYDKPIQNKMKRKQKLKQNSEEEIKKKFHDKKTHSKNDKTSFESSKSEDKSQLSKDVSEIDGSRGLNELQEPVLITIVSSNESDSRSESEDFSTQRTKQRRYKKFTRRQTTKKRRFQIKTIKARKGFSTTTGSDEGLSIEHVGTRLNLYPRRKSNDNDTFSKIVTHTTLRYSPKDTGNKNQTIGKNNVKERSTDDRKTKTSLEDKSENFDNEIVSENIRLSGDIKFETPTKATQINKYTVKEITPIFKTEDDALKHIKVNVTSTTVQFDDIKPTVILRSNDFNETHLTSEKPPVELVKPTKVRTTASTAKKENVNENGGDKINTKTIHDGLENELESIMDRYNTSSNLDLDHFFRENETYGANNNEKVKNQMKADLEKLFAPPTTSTKSSDTQMFTDPFKEIVEAIDLL